MGSLGLPELLVILVIVVLIFALGNHATAGAHSTGGTKPTATVATNLRHYLTYYMATSFAWDTFRAVGNAALVLVAGRPLLGALDRAARRMRLDGNVWQHVR